MSCISISTNVLVHFLLFCSCTHLEQSGRLWLFWQAWWRGSRCTCLHRTAWHRWYWWSAPTTMRAPTQSCCPLELHRETDRYYTSLHITRKLKWWGSSRQCGWETLAAVWSDCHDFSAQSFLCSFPLIKLISSSCVVHYPKQTETIEFYVHAIQFEYTAHTHTHTQGQLDREWMRRRVEETHWDSSMNVRWLRHDTLKRRGRCYVNFLPLHDTEQKINTN